MKNVYKTLSLIALRDVTVRLTVSSLLSFALTHYRLSVVLRRISAFKNAINAYLQLLKTQIFLPTRYNEPHYNELFV